MTEPSLPFDERAFVTVGEDGDGRVEAIPGMGVCDFCTGVPIVASFPCAAVMIATADVTHVSRDPWGACQECHDLIDADDRHGLLDRSAASLEAANGPFDEGTRVFMRNTLEGIQEQFFMGRIGPPTLRS